MSRHHDKLIQQLTAPEEKPRRTEARTPQEVESFVKGFGLSAAATRQMVAAWNQDIQNSWSQGYHEGYEWAQD